MAFPYWKVSRHFVPVYRRDRFVRIAASLFVTLIASSILHAQGAKQQFPDTPIPDTDADHVRQRNEWFFRGRLIPGKPAAELRRRAYDVKLRIRREHTANLATPNTATPASSGSWTPLGPVPLASDATGNGTQDYRQVAGRATAVAIDPADPSGNTISFNDR